MTAIDLLNKKIQLDAASVAASAKVTDDKAQLATDTASSAQADADSKSASSLFDTTLAALKKRGVDSVKSPTGTTYFWDDTNHETVVLNPQDASTVVVDDILNPSPATPGTGSPDPNSANASS